MFLRNSLHLIYLILSFTLLFPNAIITGKINDSNSGDPLVGVNIILFETTKKVEVLQDYYSYTPSIFTTNNDGHNDIFQPSLLNIDKKSYTLMIFDRWGNEVFYTKNYDVGWNGKLQNGDFLPPDVYSYKILYNTNLGVAKEEKGKLIMAK